MILLLEGSPFIVDIFMVGYVITAGIVALVSRMVWFQYLFPKVDTELLGSEDAAREARGKNLALLVIALVVLAVAMGTFIENRGIRNNVDIVKLAIKVWLGFFLPLILVNWGHSKGSVTTLVGVAGYWLLVGVEYSVIASWLLLQAG